MYAIRSIDIRSCAKISGALYGALAVLVVPFGIIGALISAMKGDAAGIGASVLLVLAPILYAVLGFLVGALTAWVYNLVAGWTGGIEIELSNKTSGSPTSSIQIGLQ